MHREKVAKNVAKVNKEQLQLRKGRKCRMIQMEIIVLKMNEES